MTDFGTTGIQVAPKAPTEDEMNTVQDILKRAINSLVGMSQLQADVDMLRSTVQSLQADTERLRQQNAGLDEALYQSRKARQELEASAQADHNAMISAQQERDAMKRDRDEYQSSFVAVSGRLDEAMKERDDYGLQVMDLEDKLEAAEAKLAAIRDGYASIFGMEHPASSVVQASEPAPVPVPVPEPLPQAAPVAEPVPTPQEPETRSDWAEGYVWDYERRVYVNSKLVEPDGAAIPS